MQKLTVTLLFLAASGLARAQAVAPPAPPPFPAPGIWAQLDLEPGQRESVEEAFAAHSDRVQSSRDQLEGELDQILTPTQREQLEAYRPAPPAPPHPPFPPRESSSRGAR